MIVNLCPHKLDIVRRDGSVFTVAPSGVVARVSTSRSPIGEVEGIELFATRFGEVTGLPEQVDGVVLVVSGLVASHPSVRNRSDVFSPGELVRGADGQPVGCKGLSKS